MLAVMLLSQYWVSTSKTVRPRASCGARCTEHAVRTMSAVCSAVPHLQFGEGARSHLCMDGWNRPTPVRRQLRLTCGARCYFLAMHNLCTFKTQCQEKNLVALLSERPS